MLSFCQNYAFCATLVLVILYETFSPGQEPPPGLLLPEQTHGTRIVQIKTGKEDLSVSDGLWTTNPQFFLGVRTADCAPIVFLGKKQFGIVHAGWRGLVHGIIEKMLELFAHDLEHVWVGPLYPVFEIQRDACYTQIQEKFGEHFFSKNPPNPLFKGGEEGMLFDFLGAIQSILPPEKTTWSGISTFEDARYVSWRRDQTTERNITVVGNMTKGL